MWGAFVLGLFIGWMTMFVTLMVAIDKPVLDQSKLSDGFTEGIPEETDDWALSKTDRKRKALKDARRNWKTCGCGEQVFVMDGFTYNAGYSREYPDRPPLMHGCDFLKLERHRMEIQ